MSIVWVVVAICGLFTLLILGGVIYYFVKQDKAEKKETGLMQGGDYTHDSDEFVENLKRSL